MKKFSEYYSVSSKNGLSKSFIDDEDGIRIVNMKELFGHNPITDEAEMRTVQLSDSELEKFQLEQGDLLFGRRSLVAEGAGKTTVFKGEKPTVFESSIIRVRLDQNKADYDFANHYFNSPVGRGIVLSIVTGAAVFGIRGSDLSNIKVDFPNLPTQKKIASILSAYDDLIENNNQRIQLLEEMAEEIYKEWFVRMRFPGYKDCKFLDKEGNEVPHGTPGALPEGWDMRKLRDCLAHYIGGGWGEEFPKGKSIIPAHVIRGTDIPNFNLGKLNFEVLRYHTKSNLSSRICEPNDIIFEVSGGTEDQSLGRTSFITRSALARFDAPVIAASFCKLIRVDKNIISPYYINSMLKRMYSTGETKVFQVQSTGISNYQFEDFIDSTKVLVPEKFIQSQFEEIIAPMIDELHALGSKNQVLQETRDLLLPRLISGKLDVSKLAINEPENLSMAAEPEGTYQMDNRTDAWKMIR